MVTSKICLLEKSEADLFLEKVFCVLGINTERLDGTKLLGLDHLDSVALLVDEKTVLLTLDLL